MPDAPTRRILSLSPVHYHPENDAAALDEHASISDEKSFLVNLTQENGPSPMMTKVSPPVRSLFQTAGALGFEYVLFEPGGSRLPELFPMFEKAWEDYSETTEFEVVASASYAGNSPYEAAQQFCDDVEESNLVVVARDIQSGAVTDVHLSDLNDLEEDTEDDEDDPVVHTTLTLHPDPSVRL